MAESLVSLRKSKGITQEALGRAIAERLRTSISGVYAQRKIARFEAGQARPTPEELFALAQELGTDVDVLEPLTRSNAPFEASAVFQGAKGGTYRCLLAVCMMGLARKDALEETLDASKHAVDSKRMSIAVFVPYPNAITCTKFTEYNNLVGYYTRVQRSIDEANLLFKNRVEKKEAVALFFPRETPSSILIPPIFRQYSLTLTVSDDETQPMTRILHAYRSFADRDTAELVKPSGVYTLDEHIDAWESYFGTVVKTWITTGTLPSADQDPFWKKIR